MDNVDWAVVTQWKRIRPPAYDPKTEDFMYEELGEGGDDEPVVELSCSTPQIRCVYRESVIRRSLDSQPTCPTCTFAFVVPGVQPSGTMTVAAIRSCCEGVSPTDHLFLFHLLASCATVPAT